jgi:P2 family phage contractile tail tube protein
MLSDTIKGSGIMGEIDWPSYLGVGSAQFSYNMRVDDVKAAYMSAPGKKRFEVRWVTDKIDTSGANIGIDSHKAVIIGVPKKYDAGKVEVNSASDGSNDLEVLYYKKTVNGKEIIEIDKLNYIYRVNGVDYGANVKSLL